MRLQQEIYVPFKSLSFMYLAELSTQQAANLLNVSRPYLIKLLESKEISCRKVGKCRRILAKDLYEYKAEIDEKRSHSLDELTALTEELDLYEDD